MAKNLPYAAWVRQQLDKLPEEEQQAARTAFYSTGGRIAKWESYRAHCKAQKLDYDGPPEGYWESKEEPWHKPTGYAVGALGVFVWFLGTIIAGSTGMKK